MRIFTSIFAAVLCLSLIGADPVPDSVDVFNGKDLTGWEGDPDLWSVKDGVIVGQTSADKPLKKNSFLIWKGGSPANFELHATWKIAGGNSGVQYRSKDMGEHVAGGYQADIVGTEPDKYTGMLYEEKGRGILVPRGTKMTIDKEGKKSTETLASSDDVLKLVKKGDWNEYVIIADGNHIIQKLNGTVTVDLTDEQTDKAAKDGIIALQLHVGAPMHVEFKDIKLKEIKGK